MTGAAATAVWYLARDPSNKAVLRESGALPPLVELLKAGPTRDACSKAAAALWSLADECNENKARAAAPPPPPPAALASPPAGAVGEAAW